MLVVNLVHQQKEITEMIESNHDNGMTFKFVKKEGIKLYFETNAENKDEAAKYIKQLIKSSPWGAGLFFNVATA